MKAEKTLESDGIDIDKSAHCTAQENGRAERMNRTLKNSVKAMGGTVNVIRKSS